MSVARLALMQQASGIVSFPIPPRVELAAYFARARRIWSERADLRRLYGSIDSLEFWAWLAWHGAEEDPELARAELPQPPSHLLERVCGAGCTLETFRRGGIVDWRRIATCLRSAGFDFLDASVLEFGCGCGRLLRHFARFSTRCRFTGVDIDAEAVAWVRANLPFAEVERSKPLPPLAFAAASFDATYSFSVFTHLPREAQSVWLAELARVLRSGGLAVLTVHGQRAIARWLSGDVASTTPDAKTLRRDLPRLEREGFLFYPFGALDSVHDANERYWDSMDRSLYGNVFLTRAHIAREWLHQFELVAYEEAPDDWQDYVVLRRR